MNSIPHPAFVPPPRRVDDRPFLTAVQEELIRATALHGPLNSAHEAYAVILEELDEFKAEVWKRTAARDPAKMREELIQIAAMCARAAADLKLR